MRIKTILLTIVLLVGFTSIKTFAQVSVGVFGFPQISNLTSKSIRTDPVINNKITFAGGGGLSLTYGFSEKLGVQVSGIYSSQNQKIRSNYTIGGVNYSHDSKKRFDYLKIPVLLRISQPMGRMNFVVFAGPQFSYLLKYDGGAIVYIKDQYFDLPTTPSGNNYYKKYTIDAVGGMGLEFPIAPLIDITSAIKIDYNVTNAQNNNAMYNNLKVSDVNGSGNAARNVTYALLVGLNFRFGDPNSLISPTNKFRGARGRKKRY